MQTLNEYVWVFIGCGGTFYAASPYLSTLVRRYSRRAVVIIDPDDIEESNQDRQWPEHLVGTTKVECADTALATFIAHDALKLVSRFQEVGRHLDKVTNGQPVLAIVNVDNDQTRLDVARWLENRVSPGIMVVSGCERTHGQAYPGIWMDGEPVYDWRNIHADVGEESSEPVNPCQAQNIQANALTGTLVGMCIEDIARRLSDGTLNFVREYYWNVGEGPTPLLAMWHTTEECGKAVFS